MASNCVPDFGHFTMRGNKPCEQVEEWEQP